MRNGTFEKSEQKFFRHSAVREVEEGQEDFGLCDRDDERKTTWMRNQTFFEQETGFNFQIGHQVADIGSGKVGER